MSPVILETLRLMRPHALSLAPALRAGTLMRSQRCAGAAESPASDLASWL